MTTQNYQTTAFSYLLDADWSFLPATLSGTAGVFMGLVIASFLGWI